MNHTLRIYPTSRALRTVSQNLREQEGFLPTLMRMDEFESRTILPEDGILFVDPLQRILLLREAASSELFAALKIKKDLVHFFSRSDALFKFFEELAAERVDFEQLRQADAYAEFETHLDILEALRESYHAALKKRGMTDKAFVSQAYCLNEGFLNNYTSVEIFLEGYLSRFELMLLGEVAAVIPVTIHYQTSRFNRKMQERFKELGVALPNNSEVTFDLGAQKILRVSPVGETVNAEVIAAKERIEQVVLALESIEKMVQEGVAPEKIALVLPDEAFKQQFMLFDALDNLNFAMGYDYTKHHLYKSLDVLYRYWQGHDDKERLLLEKYGLSYDQIAQLSPGKRMDVNAFFTMLEGVHLHMVDQASKAYNSDVEEQYRSFVTLFASEELPAKEWLFLWLKALSKITIDDVRGGKITVLGVLETRGVQFDGVVIVDFNEGIVPASSAKDQFLNSLVRRFASLPTRSDREALQKQYYKRLLEGAKSATIIYDSAEEKLPSKFLYELGLQSAAVKEGDLGLLYPSGGSFGSESDPVVEKFDASKMQWSASRFKTFLECKRKFYYRYIREIKAKKEEDLNEGAFLHMLLDHLHREHDRYESAEEIMAEIERLIDTLLPQHDAQNRYRSLLWKEKLKGYAKTQAAHFAQGWSVVEREKEYLCEIGGVRFGGRIDRIDQDSTQTLVIDYKSGNVAKEPRKFVPEKITDFQMPIYYRMLEGHYQNVSLAYCKIFEQGAMQEVAHLEERLMLLDELVGELRRMEGFVAARCEDLSHCTYCEYRLMCSRGEYL
jgi:ATP-dependent helicase/nuclease subunit B